MPPQKSIRASVVETASYIPLSSARLYQLIDEGVLPKPINGTVDVKQTIRLAWNNSVKKATKGDLDKAKIKESEARTEKLQIEIKRAKGEYLDAAIVNQVWGGIIKALRSAMLAFPTKRAPLCVGLKSVRVAQQMLKEACYELLNDLSELPPGSYSGGGGNETAETTARSNNKRVGGRKQAVKPGGKRGTRKVGNGKG